MHTITRLPKIHLHPHNTVQQKSAEYISNFLVETLQKDKVLLLLSGGSALKMYKQMFQLLVETQSDLSSLTVSLFDERFVLKGDADSNEEQLKEVGVLDLLSRHNAHFISYLSEINRSGLEVAQRVCNDFSQQLESGKKLIILAGIGDDGHTAGLLPTGNSLIIQEIFQSKNDVEYYELADDVVNHFRQRLTATPHLIQRADSIIVYAIGEKKKQALERFVKNKEEIAECPSLCLLKVKSEVVVFTDQKLD